MDEQNKKRISTILKPEIQQHEDAALKVSMQFFADELLPYLGIDGKVIGFAPTEQVHLELHKMFQDFNLVMEDGSWKHFEFQSTNEGIDGLKRFRVYEATSSYQYKTEVTTYVLFSGKIKNPKTEFSEGCNTYRVIPIIMQDKNADVLLNELLQRQKEGKELTKKDVVPLTLCLLMDGKMPHKERVKTAYGITGNATGIPKEDIQKIEAVIYAMADKFLESTEKDEIMEVVRMTRLGQKLVNEGIEEAKIRLAKNLLDILNEQTIAERTELPLETVQRLKMEAEGK